MDYLDENVENTSYVLYNRQIKALDISFTWLAIKMENWWTTKSMCLSQKRIIKESRKWSGKYSKNENDTEWTVKYKLLTLEPIWRKQSYSQQDC